MANGAENAKAETGLGLARPRLSFKSALRSIGFGPITLAMLAWLVIAFGVRPLFLAACHGAGGPAGEWLQSRLGLFNLARQAGLMQWASFAGVLVLAAQIHIRFGRASDFLKVRYAPLAIAGGYALLMFAAYMVFLWEPVTTLSIIAHDSFIFYDSTYRIAQGQVPSVDFPTALGAVTLYLPALGAWLGGGYAGSVEFASAIFALILGLATAQAGASRLPVTVTSLLVVLVFLIVVPTALLGGWEGDSLTIVGGKHELVNDGLTYAMFYNTWGWAALIPVFAWLAPRRDGSTPPAYEVVVFGALLAVLFYLKLSYFLVGIGAAGLYAFLNPKPLRTLAIGAGVAAVLILLAGAPSGLLFAYLRDVAYTAGISGGRTGLLLGILRMNVQGLILGVAPLGLLAVMGRFTWRDAAVGALVALGSLFIVNQNGHFNGMPSLIMLSVYAIARISSGPEPDRMARVAIYGIFGLMLAQPLIGRSLSMIDQSAANRREELREATPWKGIPALKGVYVAERESFLQRIQNADTPAKRLDTFFLAGELRRHQPLRQGEYMETLVAGAAELRSVMRPGDSVVTLDMSNPFPFMLGARPAKGSWLTMDNGRTITEEVHPDAAKIFADADHVVIAKVSLAPATSELALEIYGPWLDKHYAERVETPYWTRFSRRLSERAELPTQAASAESR